LADVLSFAVAAAPTPPLVPMAHPINELIVQVVRLLLGM
jgi:hypothetical protein